jgi:hypothetical protein
MDNKVAKTFLIIGIIFILLSICGQFYMYLPRDYTVIQANIIPFLLQGQIMPYVLSLMTTPLFIIGVIFIVIGISRQAKKHN